ncbi:hypothetical protein F4823DRAFT_564881 [Ustulina deusta]|nr:hypothetical protein F4823DRAFT_564881 [Ustulina deusta]
MPARFSTSNAQNEGRATGVVSICSQEKGNKARRARRAGRGIARGPFKECVAGDDDDDDVATGACFNCYCSGFSHRCSIRQDMERRKGERDGARRARKARIERPSPEDFERISWRQLDVCERAISNEEMARVVQTRLR